MRNINHGRVQFTYREEAWDDRRGCVVVIGIDDNGAEFRWPSKDVTDNPAYFPKP